MSRARRRLIHFCSPTDDASEMKASISGYKFIDPQIAEAEVNMAVDSAKRGRWQDAIRYAQTALERGSNALALYDALASAHGWLGQWEQARRHGLQALTMRDRLFGGQPVIPLPEPGPLPPLPSAQTREHNLIAFSLFGGDPTYCELAVLNVQEQPDIYPHWVCRFYVDDSVPASVIDRLRQGGAQIVRVAEGGGCGAMAETDVAAAGAR